MPAGRFAPSPTGTLHIGNLRTALLAWLFARSSGGRFLLRIEDLDPQRSRRAYEREQLDDLRSLGLDWDGAVVRQSSRLALYGEALDRLTDAGLVYECWCTRAEIRAAASAPHGPLPEGAYPGTCRRLSPSQRSERRRAASRPPALRLDAGAPRVEFVDRLLGARSGVVDDFVLRRGDGASAYNLAVVVDDSVQGIEEVVRGADLLDTTPRQLLLARLLGLRALEYAHVPLVVGPDRARLAKRHGAVTLADGIAPSAALGWMASSLGLRSASSATDLLDAFDPERLPAEPTVFNPHGVGSPPPGGGRRA